MENESKISNKEKYERLLNQIQSEKRKNGDISKNKLVTNQHLLTLSSTENKFDKINNIDFKEFFSSDNKKTNIHENKLSDTSVQYREDEKTKLRKKLDETYERYDIPNYNKKSKMNNFLDTNINSNPFLKIIGTKKIFDFLGIPIKYDEINTYAKWWKFYDNLITSCNLIIVILAFYDYELNFSYPRKIIADYNSIRLIMISLSLFSIFCVFRRHRFKEKWRNIKLTNKVSYGGLSGVKKYNYLDQFYDDNRSQSYQMKKEEEEYNYDNFEDYFLGEDKLIIDNTGNNSPFLSIRLLMDLLINLIMPYPGLDFIIKIKELDRDKNEVVEIEYLLSDFIYLIIILRFIFLIRAAINYSIFSDNYAMEICKEHKIANNIRFAIKCLLKTHHIKVVMLFFCAGVIVCGFILRIIDRPFWVQKGSIEFDSYFVPMWTVFVSMLTIGYGDYYPITLLGKFIIYVSSLWGVFICSLIIVCLQGLLDLSNDQFIVFTKILKSRTAMKFIESAYILHSKKRNFTNKREFHIKYSYLNFQLLQNFYEFKNMRNESKSVYRSNGLMHYNMKMLKEMKKIHQKIDKFEITIDDTKKRI